MDQYIKISTLNDFMFCPKSIYFHELYGKYNFHVFQWNKQIQWKYNHRNIDEQKYSSSTNILQWIDVYSEKYWLIGKIDLYHKEKKSLMERKTKISKVYQWQIWQIYAQYFCLVEMWYEVERLKIYSMEDNKVYDIQIPNSLEIQKFEDFLTNYKKFNILDNNYKANPEKCAKCIYSELCNSRQ